LKDKLQPLGGNKVSETSSFCKDTIMISSGTQHLLLKKEEKGMLQTA
jgi:hypothetical protein